MKVEDEQLFNVLERGFFERGAEILYTTVRNVEILKKQKIAIFMSRENTDQASCLVSKNAATFSMGPLILRRRDHSPFNMEASFELAILSIGLPGFSLCIRKALLFFGSFVILPESVCIYF